MLADAADSGKSRPLYIIRADVTRARLFRARKRDRSEIGAALIGRLKRFRLRPKENRADWTVDALGWSSKQHSDLASASITSGPTRPQLSMQNEMGSEFQIQDLYLKRPLL